MCLWDYADQDEGHGRIPTAGSNEIVQLTFVVRDAGRHLVRQHLHRQYFYPNVNDITNVEGQVLYEQIICDERILDRKSVV